MALSRIRINQPGTGDFLKAFETNDGTEDVNAQAVVLTDGTSGDQVGTPTDPLAVSGADADGAPPTQNPVLVAGQDGTNVQTIKTDTDGRLETVTAAGTASGALGALNATVSLVVGSNTCIGFALSGGPLTGTIIPEESYDGGATWKQTVFIESFVTQVLTGIATTASLINPTGAEYGSILLDGGVTDVRIRVSAYTVGSVTARVVSNIADTIGAAVRLALGLPSLSSPGAGLMVGGTDSTVLRALRTDSTGRQLVVGAAADGAAVAGNPVLMGGQDGTNVQSLKTDTTGRQEVIGGAAVGAALTGNPVPIAASDGTNVRIPRAFDMDTGAGTEYGFGVNLRAARSGGSQEIGVAALPLSIAGSKDDGDTPSAEQSFPVIVGGIGVGGLLAGAVNSFRTYDGDSGGGVEYTAGVILRRPGVGGSVEAGTDVSPFSVVGAIDDGDPALGPPVIIAGQDGTNVQTLKTDTAGRIEIGGIGTLANGVETAVAAAAVQVLAANANRKTAIIQNTGLANIRVGVAGVTNVTGAQSVPGATMIFDEPFVHTGAVFAIREGGTSSVAFAQEIT